MHKDLADQVAKLENETRALLIRMDDPCRKFLAVFADAVRSWFMEKTSRLLKEQHDQTLRLGRERMMSLRAEVEQLALDAPRLVAEHLDVDRLWVHRTAHSIRCLAA